MIDDDVPEREETFGLAIVGVSPSTNLLAANARQLAQSAVVTIYDGTGRYADTQTHVPIKFNITYDNPTVPFPISEDGGTGDFTFTLSEALEEGEVYDLHLYPEKAQYTPVSCKKVS